MFGSVRRSPLRGLALVALGFFLASVVVGGGSAGAAGLGIGLLVLPFLFLKMMFMFFLFGAFFRFVGMGRPGGGGFGWRSGPWQAKGGGGYKSDDFYPWERNRQQESEMERREWEESLRRARADVDDLDAPTPGPDGGFEPPAPSTPSD